MSSHRFPARVDIYVPPRSKFPEFGFLNTADDHECSNLPSLMNEGMIDASVAGTSHSNFMPRNTLLFGDAIRFEKRRTGKFANDERFSNMLDMKVFKENADEEKVKVKELVKGIERVTIRDATKDNNMDMEMAASKDIIKQIKKGVMAELASRVTTDLAKDESEKNRHFLVIADSKGNILTFMRLQGDNYRDSILAALTSLDGVLPNSPEN